MNIYDFDETIYDGNSLTDFLKYSFVNKPFIVILSLVKSTGLIIIYVFNKNNIEKLKSVMFSYMNKISNKVQFIENFVNQNKYKIKKWYKSNQRKDDIIISASCDFWIKPFCNSIGISNVIATKTNDKFEVIGKNCKSSEKINRLNEEYPNIDVNNAYSDSLSDTPMFEVAKKGYLVDKNKLVLFKK